MRKKNVAMTGNFIVMVLLILGAAAYYILKWTFKLLCLITAAIVKAVRNAVKKHRRKKAEKDITDVPFVDTELNIEETSTAPAAKSETLEKRGLIIAWRIGKRSWSETAAMMSGALTRMSWRRTITILRMTNKALEQSIILSLHIYYVSAVIDLAAKVCYITYR